MEGGGSSGGGVRLHVGGLGESVGRDDLIKIFSPMGSVEAVEFVRTKGRSFAYIDFSPSSENSLTKLFSTFNGCKWKGGKLRLEKAKEHYLARLKREWAEAASTSVSDDTVKAPEKSTPSTHLNIFFPRLRKVKAMPLSGTGKHKYSFQRVAVSSLLPKTFCDCEEHSASLTPQETRARDLEALNVGINEEEVNIMNSVMNKLLGKHDSNINEKDNSNITEKDDSNINDKDDSNINDKDNIVINVVSNGKDMMDTELDILSRKRKSMLDQTSASGEGYIEGQKGNHIHPSKKKQSIIPEGKRQEASQDICEKKKPSKVVPDRSSDEPSRTTGVKRTSDNISWSQKSSWKALVANGNSSNFSVSSFLPGVSSGNSVKPESGNTDLAELPSQENSEELDVQTSTERQTVKTKIKKTKSKRLTSTVMAGNLPVADDREMNITTATDDVDSDHSEDTVASDINVDAELLELAASTEGDSEDDCSNMEKDENVAEDINVDAELAASTEGDSEDDCLNVEKDENVAEDLNAGKESLALEDSMDQDVDKEDTEKGQVEACKKSAGGSLWIQKASWTQLVSDKNASFSITQLLPNLASEKNEADRVNNSGDGQFTYSSQSGNGMKQTDYSCGTDGVEAAVVHGCSSTPVRSLKESPQIPKAKSVSKGSRVGKKKPIRREIGSGETCAFMRSETSVNEWRRVKKALSEPSRKKKEEK